MNKEPDPKFIVQQLNKANQARQAVRHAAWAKFCDAKDAFEEIMYIKLDERHDNATLQSTWGRAQTAYANLMDAWRKYCEISGDNWK